MSENPAYEIESLQHEERRFPPPESVAAGSIASAELYAAAKADRVGFWADQARELLQWREPFTQALDWSGAPVARWFADGSLNVAENCLDRHVAAGLGDRVAIHWVGEPGDVRSITYAELTDEVKRAANALADLAAVGRIHDVSFVVADEIAVRDVVLAPVEEAAE